MVHIEKDSFQTLAVLHWYWQQISKNKQETRHGTEHNQSGREKRTQNTLKIETEDETEEKLSPV